jgi:hypothetical protein
MGPKPQDMTAESLPVAGAHRVNWNTVGSFFNMLEKTATENNLPGTPGNVSNVNENGTQVNSSDTVITDKRPKNTRVLSSGIMNEYITVIAYCKASDQYLLPVQLFKDVNKNRIWGLVYS